MNWERLYFVNGTAYAGKSTLVKRLAEAFGGIACQENYHDALLPGLEPAEYPCLTWSRDLQDWRAFIRRTPEEYERWIDGVTLECARLELQLLEPLSRQGRPVFVDTNLSPAQLRQQTDKGHMLILLAEPGVSVTRFFQRPVREKQFLYRLLQTEPDPAAAMENFRQCLARINSPARYEAFLRCGYPVLLRDDARTPEQTMALAAERFGLTR